MLVAQANYFVGGRTSRPFTLFVIMPFMIRFSVGVFAGNLWSGAPFSGVRAVRLFGMSGGIMFIGGHWWFALEQEESGDGQDGYGHYGYEYRLFQVYLLTGFKR
jgi:hypothetical protein